MVAPLAIMVERGRMDSGRDADDLRERATRVARRTLPDRLRVVTDTTEFTEIERDDVVLLGDRDFLVDGTLTEGRFGIDDQPKFWVRSVTDLEDGASRILKCVFLEEFTMRVGPIRIPCWRSPGKEGDVLDFVRGDDRFMQGVSLEDERGNLVRVLDRIPGPSLYRHLATQETPHEQFFHESFPALLGRLYRAIEGIEALHQADLCHGDIRVDHLIFDHPGGEMRWIDFDLVQGFSDFDLWSLGNILAWCVGMGEHTFQSVRRDPRFADHVIDTLVREDGSVFFNHRVFNLKKLFPYIPAALNDVLVRFSIADGEGYSSVGELLDDLGQAYGSLVSRGP
jgi:hypothetical protein